MNHQELATVLFALRFMQANYDELESDGIIEDSEHFKECDPLTGQEIDALCEQLNTDQDNAGDDTHGAPACNPAEETSATLWRFVERVASGNAEQSDLEREADALLTAKGVQL